VRFNGGEPIDAITESLVAHYGPNIRGSPTLDGFGAVAFLVPALLFVGGGLFILRWLRRNTARRAARGDLTTLLFAALQSAPRASDLGCGCAADAPASRSPGHRGARGIGVDSRWLQPVRSRAPTAPFTTRRPIRCRSSRPASAVADTVELHETMEHDGMVHMTHHRRHCASRLGTP
jgi:hypothetical protein